MPGNTANLRKATAARTASAAARAENALVAMIKAVNGSWRRRVPAKLGSGGCAGGHGPGFAATGVLPVRRPTP